MSKFSIFAICFILSLTLLSCAYASDDNETAIVDYSSIEGTEFYENKIANISLSTPCNEITLEEENLVDDIVVGNNYTNSFEIINNAEYGEEECDFGSENKQDIYIYRFF